MRLALLSALSLAILIPASACASGEATAAELPGDLSFEIEPSDKAGMVQLELSYRTANSRNINSHPISLADLSGLAAADLDSGEGRPISFRIHRDAGNFSCEGIARRGRATGDCSFATDAAFSAALAQRGIGAPDTRQAFSLAMANVGLPLVDELKRQDYDRPTIDQLVDAGHHGVTLDYLKGMSGSGYRVGTLPALIRMRDHGVTVEYVQQMGAAGLRDIPADTLVEMRDHGVSPGFIGELRELGYRNVPLRELIGLRDHGVTTDYVRALAEHGIKGVPTADLIRMRDHGVGAEFVAALNRHGYGRIGTDAIVRMRDHGVSGDFVGALAELGYKSLSADEIIRMRDHGVTAEFVRRANAGGLRSPDELIRLRSGG
jgi:hypothetical protein